MLRALLSDPTLQLRVRRRLRSADPWVSAALLAALYTIRPLREFLAAAGGETILTFVIFFGIVCAIPLGASELIELDKDGRLDQVRLAGQSPGRILLVLLFARAGLALVAGSVVAAIMWWRNGGGLGQGLLLIALLIGSFAVAVLGVALRPRSPRFDVRLALVGVLTVVLFAAGGFLLDRRMIADPSSPSYRFRFSHLNVATGLLIIDAVLLAMAWPRAVRHLQRPAAPRPERPSRFPAGVGGGSAMLGRVLRTTFSAALLAGAVGIVSVILLRMAAAGARPRVAAELHGVAQAMSLLPLGVAAIVILMNARADGLTRRIDMLRLVPGTETRWLLWHVAGHWLPFYFTALVVYVTSGLAHGFAPAGDAEFSVSPFLLVTVLTACAMVAPMPFAEGWRGGAPLAYTAPFFGAIVVLLLAPLSASIAIRAGLLAWIPWMLATRTWRHLDAPPFGGWRGLAVTASLTAALLWPDETVLSGARMLAAALLIAAPLCGDPESGRFVDRLAPPLVAAATAAVLTGADPRAGLVGVIAAAALWLGRRLSEIGGRRNPEHGVVTRLVAAVAIAGTDRPRSSMIEGFVGLYAATPPPRWLTLADGLGLIAGLLLAGIIVTEIVRRARKPQ